MKSMTQLNAYRRRVYQPETQVSCEQRQPGNDARATHRDAMPFHGHRRLRPDREGQSHATPCTAMQCHFVNFGCLDLTRRPAARKHSIASLHQQCPSTTNRSAEPHRITHPHCIEYSQHHASSRRLRNYSQKGNSSSWMPPSLHSPVQPH